MVSQRWLGQCGFDWASASLGRAILPQPGQKNLVKARLQRSPLCLAIAALQYPLAQLTA